LAELVSAVERTCPNLGRLVSERGVLSRYYLFSIDGEQFIKDAATCVPAGSRLLILGADAGG
jgi:hypothetical protein